MLSCARLSPLLWWSVVFAWAVAVGVVWESTCSAAKASSSSSAAAAAAAVAAENDTTVVGSLVHLTRVAAPVDDLLGAGSKKRVDDFFNDDKFAKQGYRKSHTSKDNDGYAKHDTFHTKDGDGFGYAQHFEFDKKGGDKKSGGYHESSSYNDDDDDDAAAGSVPKFSEWHFEQHSGSPAKSYRYEGSSADGRNGKLVGPDYIESKGLSSSSSSLSSPSSGASRRAKRKKEPQPSATEYDNYEYADVEEADDPPPADFEGEEGDPEYGALYADADAYDYY